MLHKIIGAKWVYNEDNAHYSGSAVMLSTAPGQHMEVLRVTASDFCHLHDQTKTQSY